MKPIPGQSLFVTLSLDTLFLPDSHPASVYYAPTPYSPLDAYQPLTPSFWKWLLLRVANAARSNPAAVASTHHVRESLQEYVELRYTAAEISSAAPSVLTPDVSAADLLALSGLTPDRPFLRTKTMTAWLPRT